MNLFYVSLLMLLGTQWGYAQTPSVSDREIRERLTVIEEKLTNLDGKVTEIKNLITSKEVAAPSTWICEGFCIYNQYSAWFDERVYATGSNSIDAMKNLVNTCKTLVDSMTRASQQDIYTDEKKREKATIKNSCHKE